MNQLLREEYVSRINRVIDYIEQNIGEELSLDELSLVANFSKFHFHRIFYSITGERLFRFIQRVRLERSASLLVNNPKKSITEIGLDCGFGNPASFSRSFRDYFKKSPSEFRNEKSNSSKENGNMDKTDSNFDKEKMIVSCYIDGTFNITGRYKMKEKMNEEASFIEAQNVEIRELPVMTVAYVRHTGPYKSNARLFENLFTRLFKWAGARSLLNFPETKSLTIYHDCPDITDEDKLRVSACITVPGNTEVSGEIGKMEIPAGKYAMCRFELGSNEFGKAWTYMFNWIFQNGYHPSGGYSFEIKKNDSDKYPRKKHLVDICIPVDKKQ